jgi:hypothetical protein
MLKRGSSTGNSDTDAKIAGANLSQRDKKGNPLTPKLSRNFHVAEFVERQPLYVSRGCGAVATIAEGIF